MGPVKFDKVNKTWSTMDSPLVFNPNISLAHLLLKSMEWNESKIAQVSTKEKRNHSRISLTSLLPSFILFNYR